MLHPSTQKLIDRLAEMTELGKLDWTEGENGSLVYSTEGYSVCLPDGASEIVIQSIDGKELERASAEALSATTSEQGTSYSQIVADMGAEAARIARGTETAISSILAGMEEPTPAAEEETTELVDEGSEDPGDEAAAMASEGIANHELKTEPEVEPEPQATAEPEQEAEAVEETITAAPVEIETSSEDDADASIDQVEEENTAEVSASSETEEESTVEVAAFDTEPEPEVSAEAEADEIDTESDVTEAVARLANEVNNRDELAEESETASPVGVAAAAAVGAVASAAGLSQEDEPEAEPEPSMDTDDEAVAVVAAAPAESISAVPYVPFGLEESSETLAPAAAFETPEPAAVEPAPTDPVAAFEAAPEAEAEPELSSSEPEVIASTELPPLVEPEAEPQIEAEPVSTIVETAPAHESTIAEVEPETSGSPPLETVAEPETELTETTPVEPVATSDDAADASTGMEPEAEAEPESEAEPVLAAPEAPKTYSLSGIGAGFGLGALSAKTEASGIPGPSSLVTPEPEKIVIDATEDVLPELEGNLNVEQMEAAVSEISFGKSENANSSDEAESEESEDGDILKPRTRFNPWD